MRTLLDTELHVHYGFFDVMARDGEYSSTDRGIKGQVNGLCGASEAGHLSLVTGLHTGKVPVRVEHHRSTPVLGPEWEDVVEVSFTTVSTELQLAAFEDVAEFDLPDRGTYRVRFCAYGMDAANEQDTRMPGEPVHDRYLLQLWLAADQPDAVVRVTSVLAAYWHTTASSTSS